MTDRANDIAEAASVIRDLLESRGLLDARLEVYAALEGASEEDATASRREDPWWRACRAHGAPCADTYAGQANIPERTLRLTAALAWRILEREAGR